MVCICVSCIRRQVDALSVTPGTESAGPREKHTLRVLLTQKKPTELNYNHRVTTASSAQYTETTKKRRWRGVVQKKKDRRREKNKRKRQPSLQKSIHAKGTDKKGQLITRN